MSLSLRDVVETVSEHLNHRLTLSEIGSIVHRSYWHLNVAFHRETGMTIHDFATCLRMIEAAAEIRRGVKVEAVASALGYRSRQTFYSNFKRHFGTSPTVLRRVSSEPSPERKRHLRSFR